MPRVVNPNPFDGLVHQIKEVSSDRGARTIVVKCGAKMPTYRTWETLAGCSGFNCEVTCPACYQVCTIHPDCPKEPPHARTP